MSESAVRVVEGDQVGTGLVGFWNAQLGVTGQGVLPVLTREVVHIGGTVGVRETVVGAGLFVPVADLAGEGERVAVLGAGLVGLALASSASPRLLSVSASPLRSPISRNSPSACCWWSAACWWRPNRA
jgi:hypothetical protein